MEVTKNQKMTILSKEIWKILISEQTMITVKCLPSCLKKVGKSLTFTSVRTQMGNIVALTYLNKNGGNKESENDYTVKRDLGDINFRTDYD